MRHEAAHAFDIYADVMLILAVIPSCRVSTPVIPLATTFLAATFVIYGERIGRITVIVRQYPADIAEAAAFDAYGNTPLQICIRHVPFAGQCSMDIKFLNTHWRTMKGRLKTFNEAVQTFLYSLQGGRRSGKIEKTGKSRGIFWFGTFLIDLEKSGLWLNICFLIGACI